MDEQLDIKIKATLSEAITEFNKLNNTALTFANTIQKTNMQFDNYGNTKKVINTLTDINNKTNKIKTTSNGAGKLIGKSFTSASKKGSDLRTVLSTAFDVNRLYFYWNLTKRVRDGIKNLVSSSIDYVETQNKFNVSMGQAKPQATKFVNTMSEAIGIAKAELMDYQSTFKNIISGLGSFTDIQSEKISESLSKMALDYSSLYNVGQSDAMEKFQSALVGSIRPIRSDSGYDVSETTIGAKAKEIGLDRSVNQLNQMEKRMLRIIVLMDQMKRTGAMNDLARTIEQPANQLRVLKAQLQETGVWLGNVFMGTLGQILPYINGFVMALKEIFKMLALFTGYVADDTNLSEVFESVQESSSGVSSNIGSANKKAKELKKTLMGFDVLNVINKQTETKGAGGASGGSSIDPKILKSLQDYESTMEKVRMKATEIRDIILDWLGVTDGTNDNLKKIWDIAKIIGLVFASWKIASGVLSFFDKLGLLDKLVGNKFKLGFGIAFAIGGLYTQYKGTERLLNGDVDIFSILETVGGTAGGAIGISSIIGALKTGKTIPLKNRLAIGFGIMLLVQSVQFAIDGIKKDDIKKKISGMLIAGISGFSLSKALGAGLSLSLKLGLTIMLAYITVVMAIDIAKWWNQYYEDTKKQLYGNKKNLNLGEFLNVSFTSVGTGLGNAINTFFGKDVMQGITDWFSEHDFAKFVLGKILNSLTLGLMSDELDVSPKDTGEAIVEGISDGMNDSAETAILGPLGPIVKIVSGISKIISNWKEDFKIVEEWWDTKIAPWFTKEKWEGLANDAKTGVETKLNEWKEKFKPVEEWWNTKIAPWFTKEKWEKIGNDAISGIKKTLNLDGIKLKMPHIKWDSDGQQTSGWVSKALSALNLPTKLPKLSVSWYKSGGFPDIGEMFVAREAGPELVGSIGNTTTVMNNDQIVQSVSRGVAQAVASVLGGKQSGGEYRFYLDGQELTARVEQRLARNANVYGTT